MEIIICGVQRQHLLDLQEQLDACEKCEHYDHASCSCVHPRVLDKTEKNCPAMAARMNQIRGKAQ